MTVTATDQTVPASAAMTQPVNKNHKQGYFLIMSIGFAKY